MRVSRSVRGPELPERVRKDRADLGQSAQSRTLAWDFIKEEEEEKEEGQGTCIL